MHLPQGQSFRESVGSARLVLPSDRKLSISIAAAWKLTLSFISELVWLLRRTGYIHSPPHHRNCNCLGLPLNSIPRSELLCLLAWVGQPEIDIHPALPEQVD